MVSFARAATLLSATAIATVSAASSPAQIYLSPAPPPLSSVVSPITLTAPQSNAVLAHYLQVSEHERLPHSVSNSPKDHAWEQALAVPQWQDSEGPKIVVMLECGSHGCSDLIPDHFANTVPYNLPNLPLHSWTAVVTLHLHRLADSLGLDLDNAAEAWGVQELVKGIKTVEGWVGWVGQELGNAIGWDRLKETVKTAVEPVLASSGLLTDLHLLDKNSDKLIVELESLSSLVDSLAVTESPDSGPQKSVPQIVSIHLSGMKDIIGSSRAQAAALTRSTLSATLAAFQRAAPSGRIVLLALPPYSPPLLRKRSAWLKPFHPLRITKRSPSPKAAALAKKNLHKRQFDEFGEAVPEAFDSATATEGRIVQAAPPTRTPVVPSSSTCFTSAEDANNQTVNCLGRGTPVLGVTVRGGECWVCSCGKTEVDGKTQYWGGEGCQKEDLSGDFSLLFFSGVGLVLILVFSVLLLAGVGSQELPGTLASVSGQGGGSRHD